MKHLLQVTAFTGLILSSAAVLAHDTELSQDYERGFTSGFLLGASLDYVPVEFTGGTSEAFQDGYTRGFATGFSVRDRVGQPPVYMIPDIGISSHGEAIMHVIESWQSTGGGLGAEPLFGEAMR